MSISIRAYANELFDDWCLGVPAYINRKAMCRDIRHHLRQLDEIIEERLKSGKKLTSNLFTDIAPYSDVVQKIQYILMVLRPRYIGGDRYLDSRVEEMDLEVSNHIYEFFSRRYYDEYPSLVCSY